jgi:hypothetical protein
MRHGQTEIKPNDLNAEDTPVLAEKFFLLLETLKSRSYPDGSQRVTSASRHVPMELPARSEAGSWGRSGIG